MERVPQLYEEIKTGRLQKLQPGEAPRGVVVLSGDQDNNFLKKKSPLQQPALFDFAKQTRVTVLVRE